ncbi:MAG: hypothetical protein DWQ37_06165 [Planctomycetota bacterium]|nr:MAG: hypothetical protein DWQ37_06165 [Planctomycetota bacterium]
MDLWRTMYEENRAPLPAGDFSTVFAPQLAAIARAFPSRAPDTTPDHVLTWATTNIQPYLAEVCRRLLLPGSGIEGGEHLEALIKRARDGHACMLCLNHRSNLDVPTLCTLLADAGQGELFEQLIWIAGRKLYEDVGRTWTLVQACNHVLVSPRSWLHAEHTEEELHQAHQLNIAAHRVIHDLRHRGYAFALFPSATRLRPGDASTAEAIEETDSYLKHFEFMLLGHIDGCTMPVSKDRDMLHETPRLDRVRYRFGRVEPTQQWRETAARRHLGCDQKTASALAIMEDIQALSH